MIKTTVKVGGMACGMCEAHVCDAIRAGIPGAEKVRASHSKGEAEFLTETAVEEELVKKTVEATGYRFGGISSHEEKKKRKWLFG